MTRNTVLAVALLLAVSCGSINNSVVVRDRGAQVLDRSELLMRWPELDLMNDAAILSAAAYDPDVPPIDLEAYCAAPSNAVVALNTDHLKWTSINSLPDLPQPPKGVRRIQGLKYRAWKKRMPDGRYVAILAFRGTTRTRGDWFSNLRWFTHVVPHRWDHYEQLEQIMDPMLEAIKADAGQDITIIATGHSLGGGLAQMAGYASRQNIRLVIAFDPSVVTYFYSLPRDTRELSRRDEKIFRVFEQGEVLSYLRWLTKRFYPVWHKDPRIVQVKFHLLSGGLVRNHSIRRFACASILTPPGGPQAKTATMP